MRVNKKWSLTPHKGYRGLVKKYPRLTHQRRCRVYIKINKKKSYYSEKAILKIKNSLAMELWKRQRRDKCVKGLVS